MAPTLPAVDRATAPTAPAAGTRAAGTGFGSVAGPGVVLLVALALPGLLGRDLWLDEAYSMAATRSPWTSIRGEHGTMALYYALLGPWSLISTSGWWIRTLSLACMAGAIVVLVAVVRRHRGAGPARWAGLFAASSYLLAHLAGEARAYGLVCLLVATGWWALDRAVAEPAAGRWWSAYWLACALLPLAHGVALLQVGAQVLAVLLARTDRRTLARTATGLGASAAVFAGLWAVGLGEEGSWVGPLTLSDAIVLAESLTHPEPVLALVVGAVVLWCAVRLGREGFAATTAVDRFRSTMWCCWGLASAVAVVVVSTVRPLQIPRYTAASALGIAGLLALGLRRPEGDARRPLPAIALLAVLVLGGALGGSSDPPFWSTAARSVQAEVADGDAFAFPNPDSRLTFEAAWLEEGGRPGLGPFDVAGVSPALGSLARYGDGLGTGALVDETVGLAADRVWVVSAWQAGATDATAAFLDDPDLRGAFDVAGTWDLPQGIVVTLLVRPRP